MISTCFEACATDPTIGAVRTAISAEADKRCAGTGNAAVDIPKILAGQNTAPTSTAAPTSTGAPSASSTAKPSSSASASATPTASASNGQVVSVVGVVAVAPLVAMMM